MKFPKEVLIERVRASRQRLIESNERENARDARRFEEERERHLRGRVLRPLINVLRRAQDGNRALTADDFAGLDASNGVRFRYAGTSPEFAILGRTRAPEPRVADTSRHDALLAVLEATQDEFITTSGLRDQGFRDLSTLL